MDRLASRKPVPHGLPLFLAGPPAEARLKKNSHAQSKGAEKTQVIRNAWRDQFIAIYAQFLREGPHLPLKAIREDAINWMNENSAHPKRITDAMALAVLRQDETQYTLAAYRESQVIRPDPALSKDEEGELFDIAAEMIRLTEERYSEAFQKFVAATIKFKVACIEAGRHDDLEDFLSEVQRAAKAACDKAPARIQKRPGEE